MKLGRSLAIVLALLLAFALSFAAAETLEPKKEISVSGKTVAITLDENPSTGHLWELSLEREGVFALLGDTYTAPDTDRVGAGGSHEWRLEAVAPGDVTATFKLLRPGDRSVASVVFVTLSADEDLNASFICSGRIEEQTVVLAFSENPTTGFEWTYEMDEQGVISDLVNNGHELEDAGETLIGAGGIHYWAFQGENEGDVTITFTYSRFWESDTDAAMTITQRYHVDKDLNVTFVGDGDVVNQADGSNAGEHDVLLSFDEDELVLLKGKTASATVTVSPDEAIAAGVTYATSDPAIATVDAKGVVKGVANGVCELIVTSNLDPAVEGRLPIHVVVMTSKMTLTATSTTVNTHQSTATVVAAQPAGETLDKYTYKTSNKRIATVDENGVVTGVNPGKVTITAYAQDGSRKRASVQVKVLQPVTGVAYKDSGIRVGVKYHGTFTMTILPKNASNKAMTWISTDPSIATVQGTTNKIKVTGKAWGRCQLIGTTVDGGYTITLDANVGSLNRAVSVNSFRVDGQGRPVYSFKNGSPLTITEIYFSLKGTTIQGDPVKLARNSNTLKGTCSTTLKLHEHTARGRFTLHHFRTFSGVSQYALAVTGWKCKEGYYDHQGNLQYEYTIPAGSRVWKYAVSGLIM